MMKLLQGKPLYIRRRVAIIATGTVAIILVLLMIYLYTHPPKDTHDPERTLIGFYTIIVEKGQSLFHRK